MVRWRKTSVLARGMPAPQTLGRSFWDKSFILNVFVNACFDVAFLGVEWTLFRVATY